MKTPQILTGQQAIDQFGLNALIECRVAVTTELNGLGHSVMQIGVIADPDNCFIDLSDEPAVLYVEIEQDDDWILHPIMADEQFVLLDDKNQPAESNAVLANSIADLTRKNSALEAQVKQLCASAFPLCDNYFDWFHSYGPALTTPSQVAEHKRWFNLRNALEPIHSQHPDDLAVDHFATAMKAKLAAARAKGRSGWDDKTSCSGEHLAQLLIEHLNKGNPGTFEDIANFAMMLHQRGEEPQLLRTALVLRDAEIKAQAVEAEYKDLLHVVANQYDGNDSSEWSIGANHVFKLFSKEIWKRSEKLRQQAKVR